ncbi:MBOAT family O-acyltransferase [Polynucleobacter ibericus]|uniref:MBOAT family O-acyltransferase n=1 Tax=Polynucleobacter ibericus TaxID=1819725 RepID=UPI001BFE51C3|nr:MBOAT family O-acyltransferase [Polynucleobacter ibericus]QWE08971.1 MBOAT family protein [Polynucleobacter ibericus]
MLFNSVTYLCFLTVMVIAYWLCSNNARRWLVLAASLAFYGFWRIEFVFLIAFSAFVDYFLSLRIYEEKCPRRRLYLLLISLNINIGLLVYFKYAYFIAENISTLGQSLDQSWDFSPGNIILPLGISFYTFLSISYTLDVYRKLFDPIRNFRDYLTYVMFWPHMIAGPILRAHELIPQIVRAPHFKLHNLIGGIKNIIIGLFLKVGLADQIAPWVDEAFKAPPSSLGGLDVWTMAFGFGLQIYFDFAGYSLIAVGSALLLGVHFPDNFNWPYLASSPREFWRRWHITLSAWIRDYLYLPLSGARFKDSSEGGIDIEFNDRSNSFRLAVALMLTWFIMGFWHGAGWMFALWGVWHATFILLYRVTKKWSPFSSAYLMNFLGWVITLPIIMLGWIPFRADSLKTSIELWQRVFDISSYRSLAFRENFYLLVFLFTFGMLLTWFLIHTKAPVIRHPWVRYSGEIMAFAIMIFLVFIFLRPISQFIYFQF